MENLFRSDARELLAFVRANRIRVDDAWRGDCQRLAEHRGSRFAFSRNGITVDDLAERLWDAGHTVRRLDCRETLDLLESLLTPAAKSAKQRGKRRGSRAIVDGIEAEAKRAKGSRNKKFICQECGRSRCNAAASTFVGICGHCYRDRGEIVFLTRVDLTFDEVMQRTAAVECAPF